MNLVQTFRRLGQQMKGWNKVFSDQDAQLELAKKLYKRNGLFITMLTPGCPEQYEVFKDGVLVASYHLRHGTFSVSCPDWGGHLIYTTEVSGDGCFDANERVPYLAKALRHVLKQLPPSI